MANDKAFTLRSSRVQDVPASMYYVPNFITEIEEKHILKKIPANKWISLSHRRLQAVPASLTASNALIASTGLPDWLMKPVVKRIDEVGVFRESPHGTVNHCLINEYLPGQGIMPHEDGGAYYPTVATVSLGGSIVLDVTEKPKQQDEGDQGCVVDRKSWRILQEPRSLLITSGAAYTETLHGIAQLHQDVDLRSDTVANWALLGDPECIQHADGQMDRQTRISLTLRDVVKVPKVASKLLGRSRP